MPWTTVLDDCLTFYAASGYDFGFSVTNSHYVVIAPIPQPTGVDPLTSSLPLSETAPGRYDDTALVGAAFFDALNNYPGAAVFAVVNGQATLRLTSTHFAARPGYYLVGVGVNASPGGGITAGDLVDFMVLFVDDAEVEVHDVAAVGLDTTSLGIALALAGHNLKVRRPTTIAGVVATQDVRVFDPTLEAVSTPELEVASDDTGLLASWLGKVTLTPDDLQNVQQTTLLDD